MSHESFVALCRTDIFLNEKKKDGSVKTSLNHPDVGGELGVKSVVRY